MFFGEKIKVEYLVISKGKTASEKKVIAWATSMFDDCYNFDSIDSQIKEKIANTKHKAQRDALDCIDMAYNGNLFTMSFTTKERYLVEKNACPNMPDKYDYRSVTRILLQVKNIK